MGNKVGRPSKKSVGMAAVDAKQQIIDAAVTLIRKIGADQLTIRREIGRAHV